MALQVLLEQEKTFFIVVVLLAYLPCQVICETGDCRQQEFRDRSGNCVLCPQCGPGMELSKECGFGYGEDAQCVMCRPHRFKEDWGFQKCKPCLDCALGNRFQKANCSQTSDAICGDCLPGFYRKTKLVGFQDTECVPCGDPPPPYEPHCTIKVNLVKIPSTASSPRDTALAAVICSALATVLLALLILCVIYCKRQFMEKKPSWSLRSQDIRYNGSELSCFDRPHLNDYGPRTCCQCRWDSAQTCGPARLSPSSCQEEACCSDRAPPACALHPPAVLQERPAGSMGEMMPAFCGSLSPSIRGEFSDAWPLIQSPLCGDSIFFCDSYPELAGEDINVLNPENENSTALFPNSGQGLVGGAALIQTHSENLTETTDFARRDNTLTEPAPAQATPAPRRLPARESEGSVNRATPASLQEA
ncbi:tumor necrosis factor receptor superfamily member 19 isoform X1 [Dasypus novemcinctus]|uniref:tumor necrosis factor receptor superfamily member 19 isoform X1 n=2 Tax=Dasypus novemcinctus TaxID=9361 RepID=UPI00265F0BD8|nr:tumor necrosis factor receptor superfamily member 19 isoform X2 [Dasypus novemcinctus]XP_058133035.1 tumor necrosis factor receptor superfamily member 19 isoform X2 [Dasypus novemcinctus]XP_058133036.1 tumor necrosis factor receptor superfamily member 19 isoform X2 [Dasypus novemcinctus]